MTRPVYLLCPPGITPADLARPVEHAPPVVRKSAPTSGSNSTLSAVGDIRAAVARHESGHAVAAVVVRALPTLAQFTPTGGVVHSVVRGRTAMQRIIINMAGSIAECGTLDEMSHGDRENITKTLRRYTGDRYHLVADAERVARWVVKTYAAAIDEVADIISKRGKAHAHEIISAVGPIARAKPKSTPRKPTAHANWF